jgi:hypothetical protein
LIFTALSTACTASPSEPALGTGSLSISERPIAITAVWAYALPLANGQLDRYAVAMSSRNVDGAELCSDRDPYYEEYDVTLVAPPGAPRTQDLPQLPLGDLPVVTVTGYYPDPIPSAGFAYFGDIYQVPSMNYGQVTITGFDGKTISGVFFAAGADWGRSVALNGSFEAPICPPLGR